MSQNATVNVDIKLGVNKFHVDEATRISFWRQIPISMNSVN